MLDSAEPKRQKSQPDPQPTARGNAPAAAAAPANNRAHHEEKAAGAQQHEEKTAGAQASQHEHALAALAQVVRDTPVPVLDNPRSAAALAAHIDAVYSQVIARLTARQRVLDDALPLVPSPDSLPLVATRVKPRALKAPALSSGIFYELLANGDLLIYEVAHPAHGAAAGAFDIFCERYFDATRDRLVSAPEADVKLPLGPGGAPRDRRCDNFVAHPHAPRGGYQNQLWGFLRVEVMKTQSYMDGHLRVQMWLSAHTTTQYVLLLRVDSERMQAALYRRGDPANAAGLIPPHQVISFGTVACNNHQWDVWTGLAYPHNVILSGFGSPGGDDQCDHADQDPYVLLFPANDVVPVQDALQPAVAPPAGGPPQHPPYIPPPVPAAGLPNTGRAYKVDLYVVQQRVLPFVRV